MERVASATAAARVVAPAAGGHWGQELAGWVALWRLVWKTAGRARAAAKSSADQRSRALLQRAMMLWRNGLVCSSWAGRVAEEKGAAKGRAIVREGFEGFAMQVCRTSFC
jgi:hypothetical protein